jgi:hypothetical protein
LASTQTEIRIAEAVEAPYAKAKAETGPGEGGPRFRLSIRNLRFWETQDAVAGVVA